MTTSDLIITVHRQCSSAEAEALRLDASIARCRETIAKSHEVVAESKTLLKRFDDLLSGITTVKS